MRRAASIAAPTADPIAAPATIPTDSPDVVELDAGIIEEFIESVDDDGEMVTDGVEFVEVEVAVVAGGEEDAVDSTVD